MTKEEIHVALLDAGTPDYVFCEFHQYLCNPGYQSLVMQKKPYIRLNYLGTALSTELNMCEECVLKALNYLSSSLHSNEFLYIINYNGSGVTLYPT